MHARTQLSLCFTPNSEILTLPFLFKALNQDDVLVCLDFPWKRSLVHSSLIDKMATWNLGEMLSSFLQLLIPRVYMINPFLTTNPCWLWRLDLHLLWAHIQGSCSLSLTVYWPEHRSELGGSITEDLNLRGLDLQMKTTQASQRLEVLPKTIELLKGRRSTT